MGLAGIITRNYIITRLHLSIAPYRDKLVSGFLIIWGYQNLRGGGLNPMKLRYLVLLAVAVLGLAFGRQPEAALAQTDNQTPAFKNVTLWLNPEYDDPRLLVMMEGKLDRKSIR